VWADTRARLSVDDRRLYAAGFSGGARHAVRVNQLCGNCLAGVIACGAGFPVDIAPSASSRFALFGMAGADDFNFPEMKLLDERLARLGFPHRLEVFDGGHSWASAHVCARAVEWMELQAMRAGRRAREEKLLGELWDKMRAKAADDEAAGRVYDAYLAYRSLAEDFAGLRDVAAAARAARLGESREVRRALDEEGAQIRRQQNLFDRIRALHESRAGAEEPAVALMEFRRAVAALRKADGGAEDTGERRVARRTLRQLFAHYYESAANLRDRGVERARVVSHLEAATEIVPDDPQVLFELAGAYAVDGEKKKALATLRKSVECGFADADAVAGSESLAPLRGEAAFKEIVARLRGKP
jgi:tetratricopeptide (TPR) repeat protein